MQEVVYLLRVQFALPRSAETAYAPNTNGWFVPGQKFGNTLIEFGTT